MSYYNQHAQEFFDSTVHVEMDSLYREFLPLVQKGGNILDAGCGSGRDSKAFKELGFQVHAIDASAVLAKLAEELIEQPVQIATFQDFESEKRFDAIWACASLLHVPFDELPHSFLNLSKSLKNNGVFYCSFKYGNDEVERNGRKFTNLDESLLKSVLSNTPLIIKTTWQTGDLREGRESEKWLNAILLKESA
ncbi:class I SAM-dependent methyltransferase [Vibrio parahaemolyticus]|uniref:class I SAM-dependent methyltransferase n=1 Tax=Vibrio TaxID=662 RepID=UPI001121B518|nr:MULTISPECIES: class I SAM-dependent methyltransferase [Vibrio]EGR2914409.1 class I SAM-dependent methyltransferase [Vibrio parahaemolyticus]EGR3154951.1 class I SAM-dependent methyltransferase [Vibrio parahaemolyticus]EIE1212823.1 class I SAM-dependent methyltransferase [Vibrio parahaemolyticus]EJC7009013.1 class I SAM-dependent methyltransferase [Vibrio parahaemolyticus]EJC7028100.1 class I SAM-dependent methyltransferase [Vibrio parahaemolyticus]